jgi:hypothetical protein
LLVGGEASVTRLSEEFADLGYVLGVFRVGQGLDGGPCIDEAGVVGVGRRGEFEGAQVGWGWLAGAVGVVGGTGMPPGQPFQALLEILT